MNEPKLIVSRRAIAAGITALIGGTATAQAICRATDIPLTVNPEDFSDFMGDGLIRPKHMHPRGRIVFNDGTFTGWHEWSGCWRHPDGRWNKNTRYDYGKAVALEISMPGPLGTPLYQHLKIY
jgi:hypothetical protein